MCSEALSSKCEVRNWRCKFSFQIISKRLHTFVELLDTIRYHFSIHINLNAHFQIESILNKDIF